MEFPKTIYMYNQYKNVVHELTLTSSAIFLAGVYRIVYKNLFDNSDFEIFYEEGRDVEKSFNGFSVSSTKIGAINIVKTSVENDIRSKNFLLQKINTLLTKYANE